MAKGFPTHTIAGFGLKYGAADYTPIADEIDLEDTLFSQPGKF